LTDLKIYIILKFNKLFNVIFILLKIKIVFIIINFSQIAKICIVNIFKNTIFILIFTVIIVYFGEH